MVWKLNQRDCFPLESVRHAKSSSVTGALLPEQNSLTRLKSGGLARPGSSLSSLNVRDHMWYRPSLGVTPCSNRALTCKPPGGVGEWLFAVLISQVYMVQQLQWQTRRWTVCQVKALFTHLTCIRIQSTAQSSRMGAAAVSAP